MANKVFDYYKELPSWAKGVVVVGGIAIVYFTSKQLIARIKKQGEIKKDMAVVIDQQNEVKVLEQTGARASFSDSQYKSWADAIQKQFDGCDFSYQNYILPESFFSYSGAKVYQILNNFKNNLDFLKLSTAWGIRTYDKCGLWNGNVENVSLSGAISDELTEIEIKDLNKLLTKKGITYRF